MSSCRATNANPFVDEIRTLAIGPSDTSVELAEQVRAAVGAQ